MTYESFVAYSAIALAILFIILILWLQNKEIKREQEIKKRFKEFDKRIEEKRRGYEVHEEDKQL